MRVPDLAGDHDAPPGLATRVQAALEPAGFGPGPIHRPDLSPLDRFHVRGLAATEDLAEAIAPRAGASVLDLGSGLGGPLAAAHGCRVTGIELTPVFVEVAEMLSRRAGLADHTRYVRGDAADLPVRPESFDHAWTEHVAMNIPHKARLYAGAYRVLKPGGRSAINDPARGDNEPVLDPVPWASDPSLSVLSSPAEISDAPRGAGFLGVSSSDVTDEGLAWFAERAAAAPRPPREGTTPLSLASVLGPDVRRWTATFAQDLREGRVRLVKTVVRKP